MPFHCSGDPNDLQGSGTVLVGSRREGESNLRNAKISIDVHHNATRSDAFVG